MSYCTLTNKKKKKKTASIRNKKNVTSRSIINFFFAYKIRYIEFWCVKLELGIYYIVLIQLTSDSRIWKQNKIKNSENEIMSFRNWIISLFLVKMKLNSPNSNWNNFTSARFCQFNYIIFYFQQMNYLFEKKAFT